MHLRKEAPEGIFITGDISNGIMTAFDLKILASTLKCPIYFILGNHDRYFSSFEESDQKFNSLCKEYPNLIWLTPIKNPTAISEEVCLIGADGWYDANLGNPEYLEYTLDWRLIKDFKGLSMKEKIDKFRDLSKQSADLIEEKLELALEQNYKTIYILTHMPPWAEATRDVGTILEKFWLPYNVNLTMGKAIEKVMKDRNKRHAIVLSGHIHEDKWIHVSRNIECKVNKAKYYGSLRNEEHIFI